MIKDMVLLVFGSSWPTIVICVIILSSVRIAYLITRKEKLILYKELLYLSFVIYILSLFYVVTFEDTNYGTNNFIPFNEILKYKFGSLTFFRNVVGNIILYIPFGLFISAYLKNRKVSVIFILTFISSISIEIVQYIIGRTYDIDDIILNIIGGVIGGLIYNLMDDINDKLPKFLKKTWFKNLIMIIVLILVVLYLTGIYW